MINLQEVLVEKEEDIQEAISSRKLELIDVLNNCIDSDTNDSFSFNRNNDYSLIELCTAATRIQSLISNIAPFPQQPNIITPENLCSNELNIRNTIQYCNNLLRYTLKKNGISFQQDLNIMEELIEKIRTINSVKKYDGYITNVVLDLNGELEITSIDFTEVATEDHLLNMFDFDTQTNDLFVDYGTYQDYDNLYVDIRLTSNGDILCTQVKDM